LGLLSCAGFWLRWTCFLPRIISGVENFTTEGGLEILKLFSLKKRIVTDLPKQEEYTAQGKNYHHLLMSMMNKEEVSWTMKDSA